MAWVIKLKKGESFVIDSEYEIISKSVRGGVTTIIVIPLGDKKPVITINAGKEDAGDEDI